MNAMLSYTLAAIADNADDHGLAWPSIETIAMKSRCDERTAIRRVLKLEKEGWLRIERRVIGKGNTYFINIDKLGVTLNSKSRRVAMWDEVDKLLKARESRAKDLARRNMTLKLVPVEVSKSEKEEATLDLFDQLDQEFSGDKLSPRTTDFEVTSEVTSEVTACTVSGDKNAVALLKNLQEPLERVEHPLPPQAGDAFVEIDPEIADAENNHGQGPELSFSDCRHGEPEFEVNARDAARWVLEQTGITPGVSSTRRLLVTIAEALSLGAKQTRQGLGELARMGVDNWPRYQAEVKFPFGFAKYWSMAAWRKPASWRRDPEMMVQARRSAAGARVESVPVDQAALCRSYAAQIRASAAAIQEAGFGDGVGPDLCALADVLDTATEYDLEQLDARLEVIDDLLDQAVLEAAPADEVRAVTKSVDADLTPYKGRMAADAIEKVRRQTLLRELRKARKLPQLGVFYMANR